MLEKKWRFWIDRGGTFTDIVAYSPQNKVYVHKLLSENPKQYSDAAIAGIRYFLGVNDKEKISASLIQEVRMGTTVATNALLERKGEPTLLLTSSGFADMLRIGDQRRPELFDLNIKLPKMLYQKAVSIPERIDIDGKDIIPFDLHGCKNILQSAHAEGFASIAIVLMHAYKYPAHEQALKLCAKKLGLIISQYLVK